MLTAYKPVDGLGRTCELLYQDSLCPHATRSFKLVEQVYPRLVLVSACHKRLGPVYASSGKENPKISNDVSSFVAFPLDYFFPSPILSYCHAVTVSLPNVDHTSHLLCLT